MNYSRLLKRLWLIVISSANTLVAPVLNIAVSLLVVRLSAVETWGSFVAVLIIVNLINHLLYWGNREFLLREYSKTPGSIAQIWQQNISSRSVLLLPAFLVAGFLPLSSYGILAAIGWIMAALLLQSFEALVIYSRRFTTSLFIEISGLALLLFGIFALQTDISSELLTFLFAATMAMKALLTILVFRRDILPNFTWAFSKRHITAAVPFLILGLSGMLQSRTDLYLVTALMSGSETGFYQILINMLIYLQTIAAFILQPFLKNIFRLPQKALYKLTLRLTAAGMLIVAFAVPLLALFIRWLYQFDITNEHVILGMLFVLPIYVYLPLIYKHYKEERTTQVVIVNLLGIMANAVGTYLLIPSYGISGALAGSAVSQWLMAAAYLSSELRGRR